MKKINSLIKEKPELIPLSFVLMGILVLFALFSPFTILFAILALVFLIFAIYKPEYGVYFLLIYTPLEQFLLKFASDEIYPFARYFGEVFLYVLFIAIIIKLISKKQFKYKKSPIDFPLALFIIVGILSMIFNLESPFIGFLGIRQIIRFFFIFYLILYSPIKKQKAKIFITILIILFLFESLLGLAQVVSGGSFDDVLLPDKNRQITDSLSIEGVEQFWQEGQRIFGTLGRYNILGAFLSIGLLLIAGLIYYIPKNNQYRKILPVIFIIGLMACYFTYSRAAWLAFILGFIVLAIFIKKDKRVIYGLIALIIIFSLYFSIYLVTTQTEIRKIVDAPRVGFVERLFEAFSYRSLMGSMRDYGRIYFIVKTPTVVVKNYPILGVGPGQYGGGAAATLHNTEKYDELGLPFGIADSYGQIDNNWLSIWGEFGTLGLLIFISIWIALFRSVLKIYKKAKDWFVKGLSLGFLGMIPALMLLAFFAPNFELRVLMITFWVIGGIIFKFKEELK